jgi:hypothetical protein
MHLGGRRITGLAKVIMISVILVVVVSLYVSISGWFHKKTLEYQFGPEAVEDSGFMDESVEEIEIPLTGFGSTNL